VGDDMSGGNNYLDLPVGFTLGLPITYADRIVAQCLDQHHCTIANAILRLGKALGIVALGRRGTCVA